MNIDSKKSLLRKQGYKLVNSNGAVKPCTWLRKSLFNKGRCYKEEFYGIKSHGCIQCTPAVHSCRHNCLFCWRPHETADDEGFDDNPLELALGIIKAHKEFLIGYNKGGVDEAKLLEANSPSQVALSLAGEPTEYPHLSDLIKIFKDKGMTVFLVTNGTNPNALSSLNELPTQLYITLPAPDEETYLRTCAPRKSEWSNILESLRIMSSLKTRRVIRLTLVRGLNLKDASGYAELIKTAEPDFVEVKAFMSVGYSRSRLPYDSMPLHNEIKDFSKKLGELIDYKLINEKKDSRVCLLASSKSPNPIISLSQSS